MFTYNLLNFLLSCIRKTFDLWLDKSALTGKFIMMHFQNTASFAGICIFVGLEKSAREKTCMSEAIKLYIQHGHIWVIGYLKLLNFAVFCTLFLCSYNQRFAGWNRKNWVNSFGTVSPFPRNGFVVYVPTKSSGTLYWSLLKVLHVVTTLELNNNVKLSCKWNCYCFRTKLSWITPKIMAIC